MKDAMAQWGSQPRLTVATGGIMTRLVLLLALVHTLLLAAASPALVRCEGMATPRG